MHRRSTNAVRAVLAAAIAALLVGGLAGLVPTLAASGRAVAGGAGQSKADAASGAGANGNGRSDCPPGKERKEECTTEGGGDGEPAIEDGIFDDVTVYATKTGFRGIVAYASESPVQGVVHYGTDPAALDQVAPAPGPADTAQLVILDGLTVGDTYYVQIEDLLSGETSGVHPLVATNAYTETVAAGAPYTLDLLVQLDSQSLPADIEPDQALEDIAAGINVMAERISDALDGHARIGEVIVMDTLVEHAGTVPGAVAAHPNKDFARAVTDGAVDVSTPCETPTNQADFLITTAMPFDSHTFGWAIDESCVPFYVGRQGQLVVPWEGDLHFGHVSSHELMHYAFGAPDLYDATGTGTGAGAGAVGGPGDCRNLAWDGSLMHNTGGWVGDRWEMTELDRNQTLTPCTHGDAEWTWDELRTRYTQVPPATAPEHVFDFLPRGNEDGGALDIHILDREPGSSTFRAYEPDDSNPEIAGTTCSATSTSLGDPTGDATKPFGVPTAAAVNHPATDLVGASLAWTGAGFELGIEVDDLTELPAPGSQGEYFDFEVNIGDVAYDITADWDRIDPTVTGPTFRAGRFGATGRETLAPLTGTWDLDTDRITITLPQSIAATEDDPGYTIDNGAVARGIKVTARRIVGVSVPDFDTAGGGCALTVPGTPPPAPEPEPKPAPDATVSATSPRYEWTGGPTTMVDPVPLGLAVDRRVVDVVVTDGATHQVTFAALASDPTINDIDLTIYDEDGNELKSSATNGGDESVTLPVGTTTRFIVEVLHYVTIEATYTASVSLA
jgi:hypothetical protein